MLKMTRDEARSKARDMGVRYRITGGEVHFYGDMPNSNKRGWYFAGYHREAPAAVIPFTEPKPRAKGWR